MSDSSRPDADKTLTAAIAEAKNSIPKPSFVGGAIRSVDQVDLQALSMAYTLGNDQATTPAVSEAHLPDALPVAASGQAPAGIVKLPGEELLEAIESEEDIVNANRELLEGRELSELETKRWQRLVSEIQREVNVRLKPKGIVLLAAVPEPNGLGFVMTGVNKEAIEAAERGVALPDSSVENYTVTVTLPARERVDIARTEREDFVRKFMDLICAECIEQQNAYRAKQRFFN